MIKEYTLVYDDEKNIQWEKIESAKIDTIFLKENRYHTEAEAKVVLTKYGLRVFMKAYEQHIHATYHGFNEDVSRDSCMEFFIKPVADDPRYINIEINPFGTMLIGIGTNKFDRHRLEEINTDIFNVFTTIFTEGERNCWSVTFDVPYTFLKFIFNSNINPKKNGSNMTCNFYKCGDHGDYLHYLAWSENGDTSQGFHNSEMFGKLNFE